MARRAALETEGPVLHVFFHQKKTVWHGWCIELGSAAAYGPTEEAVRRLVYEEMARKGITSVAVVEEIVRRGRVDLASGGIHTQGSSYQ